MSHTHTVYCTRCGTGVLSTFKMCPSCGGREFSSTPVEPIAPSPKIPLSKPVSSALQAAVGAREQDIGTLPFAGFWIRTGAYLIDTLIVVAAIFIFSFIWGLLYGVSYSFGMSWSYEEVYFRGFVFGAIFTWIYFALSESSSWQATLGKRALGLRVVGETGERIGFGRATGRYFGKYVSSLFLGIGFLMVAFTEKKQGLHDMMASTYVLQQ